MDKSRRSVSPYSRTVKRNKRNGGGVPEAATLAEAMAVHKAANEQSALARHFGDPMPGRSALDQMGGIYVER